MSHRDHIASMIIKNDVHARTKNKKKSQNKKITYPFHKDKLK